MMMDDNNGGGSGGSSSSGGGNNGNNGNNGKGGGEAKKRRSSFASDDSRNDDKKEAGSSGNNSAASGHPSSASSSSKRRMITSPTHNNNNNTTSPIDQLSDELLVKIITTTSYYPSIHLVCRRWYQLYFKCFMLSEKILQTLERRFLILNPHPIELTERANLIRRMFVRLRQIALSRNCTIEQLFLVKPTATATASIYTSSSSTSTSTSTSTNEDPIATVDPIHQFKQRLTKLRYPILSQLSRLASPKNSPYTLLRLDYSPYGIAFDEAECNLFVVDSDYDRVLVYHIKSDKIGSMPASASTSVPSSPSTSATASTSASASTPTSASLYLPLNIEFCRELTVKGCPTGVAFNSINRNLIITCRGDQAIREFDPSKGILIRYVLC